jgi:hypothetical protein
VNMLGNVATIIVRFSIIRTAGVCLQNIWPTWVLEIVETFGFVARLTAFLRANVSALSFLLAVSIASLLPQYTSSGSYFLLAAAT